MPIRYARYAMILPIVVSLSTVTAQAAPSLSDQKAWTETDKKEFLDYLRTGQGAPITGQVREIAPSETEPSRRSYSRKPYYATLEGITGMTTARSGSGASSDRFLTVGPRLLVGGHLFSWVRYFAGIEYSRLSETLQDSTTLKTGHFQLPLGVELALIPLGFPHTQYFILRAGLATHYFSGTPSVSATALRGVYESWNLGLGYEWQIKESGFRVHALADAQWAFRFRETSFYSMGVTAGVAYMF